MYVCIRVSVWFHVCACIYIKFCVHVCVCFHVCIHVYVCFQASVCFHVYACIYVSFFVSMFVFVYKFVFVSMFMLQSMLVFVSMFVLVSDVSMLVLSIHVCVLQSALPLSSILFRGGKHVHPQCPPRLDLQFLKTYNWSRAPMHSNKVHVLKLSDIRGWSMLCEDAGRWTVGQRDNHCLISYIHSFWIFI